MSRRRELLSEEDAKALWERALEMQFEAARRHDEAATGSLLAGAAGDEGGLLDGLPVEEVTTAALEAGIGQEYMALALVEREVTRKPLRWLQGRGGRASRRLLPDQPRAIEVTRQIRGEPLAVLEAVQRIFPAPPYQLELVDSHGDHPTRDGILVFRVPGMQTYNQGASFAWDMACGTVTHLLLCIRSSGEGEAASQVTLRAPLLEHTRQSYWLGLGAAGLLGLGGGALGVAIGILLTGGMAAPALAGGALLAGVAGAGLGGGGFLGVRGARGMYLWGIGKARESLERLLQVVDVNARTGGSFPRPLPPPDGGPPGSATGPRSAPAWGSSPAP